MTHVPTPPLNARTRPSFSLRFIRLGWNGTPRPYRVLLGLLLPAWLGIALPAMIHDRPWEAAFLLCLVLALTGFVLVQMHKDGRHMAAERAAAAIAAFLPLIDAVIAERHPDAELWEIGPTKDGRMKAGLWSTDDPGSDTGFAILPLPSWIGDQALFLARQQGLPDATPLHALGPKARWRRPLFQKKAGSAHARLAARHTLREALAPHLRAAFDAQPL